MPVTADSSRDTETFTAECAGNDIRVLVKGDALFDAMPCDFASARRRWLEPCIFADDAIGQEFTKVPSDCCRCTPNVRVRVDASGSHFGLSGGLPRRLKEAGVRFV